MKGAPVYGLTAKASLRRINILLRIKESEMKGGLRAESKPETFKPLWLKPLGGRGLFENEKNLCVEHIKYTRPPQGVFLRRVFLRTSDLR